jgi:hypothetical protein
VSGRIRHPYDFELEPEVRDWLDGLSDSDFKRVDEVCGMLAERDTELGGPWSDHLTVFRKTRQHDQRQIDRAVGHRRPVNVTTVAPRRRPTKGRCDDP